MMSDLISRQAAIDALEKYNLKYPKYMERFVTELTDAIKKDLTDDMKELPSAQEGRSRQIVNCRLRVTLSECHSLGLSLR